MNEILIKLENDDHTLSPTTFSLTETNKFLSSLCDVLNASENGAASFIYLESIEDNCVLYKMKTVGVAATAITTLFSCFNTTSNWNDYPIDFYNKAIKFHKTITSKNMECVFLDSDTNTVKMKISKKHPMPNIEKNIMKYHTTIFGELIDIGGIKPNAHIIPLGESKSITCSISKELATKLGSRLYTTVGLAGEVLSESGNIVSMKVETIDPYVKKDNPFIELAELSKDFLNSIDDNYINDMRGRERI